MSQAAGALRGELQERALAHAVRLALPFQLLPRGERSVLFAPSGEAHGNFFGPSYQAILRTQAWARRLGKAHTAHRRLRPLAHWPWRELDCAASSDALLMSIFCAPGVLGSRRVAALLGTAPEAAARFGFKPRTPLVSGKGGKPRVDSTEVDLALGDVSPLLIEAKLTESGFQTARPALVERFRDFEQVFHPGLLPRTVPRPTGQVAWSAAEERTVELTRGTPGLFQHYQLLRGALAAHALGGRFALLCDARRADLSEAWFRVLAAVRSPSLAARLQLVTWQELAGTLPPPLQLFLADKYGILPA